MTTRHFERDARPDRQCITEEMCRRVLAAPLHTEAQADGGIRHWAEVTIPGMDGPRILRVVTRGDGETIVTAFLDRDFAKRRRRLR